MSHELDVSILQAKDVRMMGFTPWTQVSVQDHHSLLCCRKLIYGRLLDLLT